MNCKHPHVKSTVFSDGKGISCCPDCTAFDAARRDVLAPQGMKIETQKEAARMMPVWLASLTDQQRREWASVSGKEAGHNEELACYGYTLDQLAKLPDISLWAHLSEVERRLQELVTERLKGQNYRQRKYRRQAALAKAEMKRRLWGGEGSNET